MKDSIASIANKYLKLSNHNIDSKAFQLQLETHPEYPSLKSISDTFDYFDIENIVAKVPKDALGELPMFFITLIERKDGMQLCLVKSVRDKIVVFDNDLRQERFELDTFKEKWDGTIIAIESNSSDTNTIKLFNFEKACLLFLGLILFIIVFLNNSYTILYLLCSLLGLLISYFIVRKSLGINDATISKVCESVSIKGGCDTVISDTKSKIFGFISLSDVCLVYFFSIVLITTLLGFNFSFFFFLSILSVPVILYSLIQQGFIIKEWCALCLLISSVLILQLVFLILSFQKISIDIVFILKSLFISLLSLLVWNFLKKIWIDNLRLENIESKFFKFKRSKVLFNTLLKKEQLINSNLIEEGNKISFGSQNPKVVIDAVTNPLCGFCVESFMSYYLLLKRHDEIQVNFIFTMFSNKTDSPAYKIFQSIISSYKQEGEEKALILLYEWFKERDFGKWYSKFGYENADDNANLINQHQNWVVVNNISATPTTILNGYFFPKEYDITDLTLFIDDFLLEEDQSELIMR
ncbi:MAG: thioredoxin domain-containing protein [Flavobacterium sp.]|uniref:vitamin K epoxide reductase family protein n=1 Tax=Flavobacterium sp. TaxID=239 RepID=UPI0022C22E84|nr:vitamin K epoxide reductase family protein [Flavobacterium sp.]MCZ8331495.1 thioredoxin domain-containing protein [Flavobacterium sp.]